MNNQFLEQIVVGAKVDTRGFKKADSALAKLNRNVKSLAASLGVAYGTRALVEYGKTAVKAFAEDDKAATILSKTLKNLGLQFADPRVREFIAQLETQYGVLDDYLRPAYQKLVTTTGDWERSQSLLKTALDLSAQSGYDVVTVAEDLGKAYVGNTKGLQKYALGIKKADLASMSFEEILKRVAKVSAGAAQEAADTYSGKLDKLTVAASNASEKIGGALLDAVIKFGGGDVDKATSKVDSFAGAIEKLIRLATGTGGMSFKDILNSVDYKFGIIPVNRPQFAPTRGGAAGAMAAQASEKKARDEAARKAKEEAAARAKLLKATQDQLKLAKAKAIFDLQKIQIEAALKGKISEEDRIRLKLMQAIEDENITQIEKYTKLLDAAQKKTKELTDVLQGIKPLNDVFKNWNFMSVKEQLASLETYFNNFAGSAASAFNALSAAQQAALGGYKPYVGASIPSVASANGNMISTVGLGTSGTGNQLPAGVTINNNIQTGVGDPNAIAEAIDQVLTDAVSRGTLKGYVTA